MTTSPTPSATEREARELLGRLTDWESRDGVRVSRDPRLKSTGESNAAIEEIERRLRELGARYHWDDRTRRFELDAIGQPPGGEVEP